jgi:hypothetical protein
VDELAIEFGASVRAPKGEVENPNALELGEADATLYGAAEEDGSAERPLAERSWLATGSSKHCEVGGHAELDSAFADLSRIRRVKRDPFAIPRSNNFSESWTGWPLKNNCCRQIAKSPENPIKTIQKEFEIVS